MTDNPFHEDGHDAMSAANDDANGEARWCPYCGSLDASFHHKSDGKRCPHKSMIGLRSKTLTGLPPGTRGAAK
jgi:hypothetical protein